MELYTTIIEWKEKDVNCLAPVGNGNYDRIQIWNKTFKRVQLDSVKPPCSLSDFDLSRCPAVDVDISITLRSILLSKVFPSSRIFAFSTCHYRTLFVVIWGLNRRLFLARHDHHDVMRHTWFLKPCIYVCMWRSSTLYTFSIRVSIDMTYMTSVYIHVSVTLFCMCMTLFLYLYTDDSNKNE